MFQTFQGIKELRLVGLSHDCLLSTMLSGDHMISALSVRKRMWPRNFQTTPKSSTVSVSSEVFVRNIWWNPTQPEVEEYRNRLVLLIFLFPSRYLPSIQLLGTNSMYTLSDYRKDSKSASWVGHILVSMRVSIIATCYLYVLTFLVGWERVILGNLHLNLHFATWHPGFPLQIQLCCREGVKSGIWDGKMSTFVGL